MSALNNKRMTVDEAVELIEKADLKTLGRMATEMKKKLHPKGMTTFVVDRNINYTNICWVDCKFCAFYTHEKKEDAFIVPNLRLGIPMRWEFIKFICIPN